MTALVVGIGNPDRGDDAIGPLVAATVGALGLPGVAVAVHDVPLALVEHLTAYDEVVVVDAAKSPGGHPGHVHVIQVDAAQLAGGAAALGAHGSGVLEAVELCRALGRLPRRLTLVGVEVEELEPGTAVTAPVAGALDTAVQAVLEALSAGTADQRER